MFLPISIQRVCIRKLQNKHCNGVEAEPLNQKLETIFVRSALDGSPGRHNGHGFIEVRGRINFAQRTPAGLLEGRFPRAGHVEDVTAVHVVHVFRDLFGLLDNGDHLAAQFGHPVVAGDKIDRGDAQGSGQHNGVATQQDDAGSKFHEASAIK
jgi:hypothetical protein